MGESGERSGLTAPAQPGRSAPTRVRSADGTDVAVHDLGGDGPTLLIAHAAGFCGGAYRPLAGHLRERFHVWAVDLRGHGDSGTASDYPWRGMAEDLLAAARLVPGPCVLFGHSMGGGAGLLAEALRPGTFPAMYLYEPVVEFVQREVDPIALAMGRAARARRDEFTSRAEAVDYLGSRRPYSRLDPGALRAFVEHGTEQVTPALVRLRCRPDTEARCYETRDKVTVDQIRAVSSEVAVGLGLLDSGGPAECAPAVVDAVSGARLVMHEGLGHLGPLEAPGRVAASVVLHIDAAGRHLTAGARADTERDDP